MNACMKLVGLGISTKANNHCPKLYLFMPELTSVQSSFYNLERATSLGNRVLSTLYFSVQSKIPTCAVCRIIKRAITMSASNFDHLAPCHGLLNRVVEKRKLKFSAAHL